MTPAQARRTQRERTEATTTALVAAARELFAQDGYVATSLDAVVERAGVTKGALYHHFDGKRELFAAVFEAEQERLVAAELEAAEREADPWRAFEAGCVAFVEACQEPGAQRIFLLDAPVALGWERIRELEAGAMAMMVAGIQRAVDEGAIEPRPVRPLAHLLFGAVCETAMVIARAPDHQNALREGVQELRRTLRAIGSPRE